MTLEMTKAHPVYVVSLSFRLDPKSPQPSDPLLSIVIRMMRVDDRSSVYRMINMFRDKGSDRITEFLKFNLGFQTFLPGHERCAGQRNRKVRLSGKWEAQRVAPAAWESTRHDEPLDISKHNIIRHTGRHVKVIYYFSCTDS